MPTTPTRPRKPQVDSLPFAFAFNDFYVELSRIVTTRFHGDLHLWLVLAAITNNSISHVMNSAPGQRKYASPAVAIEEDYLYIKLLSLSEIVGLPRTTVRRKAAKLVELGFIEHDGKLGYRIIKGRLADSEEVNRILIEQHALFERIVRQMSDRGLLQPVSGGKSSRRRD